MGSKPDEVVVIGTETVVEFIAIVSKIVEKHKTFDKLCFALTLITKYILSVRKVEWLRKLFFSYRNIVLGYFFCMSFFSFIFSYLEGVHEDFCFFSCSWVVFVLDTIWWALVWAKSQYILRGLRKQK